MEWVYQPVIPGYERIMFNNAMQRHPDKYYYSPIAIAKRDEIGTKYRFLCIAAPKNGTNPPPHFADIEIYKPFAGMPYITGLYKINYDKMFSHRLPLL